MRRPAMIVMLAGALLAGGCRERSDAIRVGAKSFTEQELLGELVAQVIERRTGLPVERRFNLGGTGICHAALTAGQLDMYVEYSGTALLDVLKQPPQHDPDAVLETVAKPYRERFGVEWLAPLGFNNTYAIAVRAADARARHWTKVSDLTSAAPGLTAGFTSEFMERPDGYPGLRRAYGIAFGRVIDLDPGLMYRALAESQVDVICAFATDPRIQEYKLRVLTDDRAFFPPYDAAPVVRADVLARHPAIRAALEELADAISASTMMQLNHEVDVAGRRPRAVIRDWLAERDAGAEPGAGTGSGVPPARGFWATLVRRRADVWEKTLEHLWLTAAAMLVAIGVGVPTGVLIHRRPGASGWVLAVTEVVQTVPSLAMLAFLFALFGVLGAGPAIAALVLYALLPVVLNTFTSLREVPAACIEAANAVGMSNRQRLWRVELPLALPVIVAGIRTAAVWTVGIATLSTYIGAGGLGDFIGRGLARNDPTLTLLGAVPAGALAVSLSLTLRLVERSLSRWRVPQRVARSGGAPGPVRGLRTALGTMLGGKRVVPREDRKDEPTMPAGVP